MTHGCNSDRGAEPANERSRMGLAEVPLTIQSSGKQHRFTVEVARSAEEQAKGLMGRPTLGADRGMMFPIEPPRPTTLWMKNMLIPIDMLFIRPDGTIAKIGENVDPKSLDPVVSTEVIATVLEISGGRSAELGIRPGDTVEWSD